MNRKLKVLSSVICGLALSSGIVLTNVQAAPTVSTKMNYNSGISLKSIIANDTYSVYCTLNNNACNAIFRYIDDNGNSATANGLRDVLVQNGYLSRAQANMIALSLFSLATETSRTGLFPESDSDGVNVLQPNKQQGKFNVVSAYHYDGETINSYHVYAVLDSEDAKTIEKWEDSGQQGNLTNFLINYGITSDYNTAKAISSAIHTVTPENFDALANSGKDILVMTDDTNGLLYFLARKPR